MNLDLDEALFEDVSSTGSTGGPLLMISPPVLASLFIVGTGGSFVPHSALDDATVLTSSASLDLKHERGLAASDAFVDPAARLSIIRRWFSLSVTELADAMRVQRPTIYAWMSARSHPKSGNLSRMRKLHDLASAWRVISQRPIGRVPKLSRDVRKSILQLLCRDVLDAAQILAALNALKPPTDARRTKLSQIAENAGLDPVSHDEAEHRVDIETGLG